ncbi:MAG: hypothetical protein O3A14_19340 [Cyanobacteria bacterium]|nr:hypothetical protein [Cyanobacteriota bacterium]
MPEIEFVGDWPESEAKAIAQSLQKSLGVGSGGGAEALVQDLEDNPTPGLLSKRQRRLIDLWRQAGSGAFQGAIAGGGDLAKALSSTQVEHQCGPGCLHDWESVYGWGSLAKAVGSLKRENGVTYRLNANNRWERFEAASGGGEVDPELRFYPSDGEFGRGVYLAVGEPSGWLRVRLRIDVTPAEVLSDEQFYELENDLAADTGLLLTNKGIKAIAKTEGDRVSMLMIRNSGDIEVQGAIAGSGTLPEGTDYRYRLVRLSPQPDGIVADVEVSPPDSEPLSKGAITESKVLFAPGSPLNGSPLVAVHRPALSRTLVRKAVERCKLDGVNLDGIRVKLAAAVPDFLPKSTVAFCLPEDRAIVLVAHDPAAAIAQQAQMLTRRLQTAVRAGAISGEEALDILQRATSLSPEWWLEMLIKRYAGAIHAAALGCIMTTDDNPWGRYLDLLRARGVEHWGDRKAISECMAEDYRVAHDPAGLPNLHTMLWDVACPEIARMAQQVLLNAIAQPWEEGLLNPRPGDLVEVLDDNLTDKAPASGPVLGRDGHVLWVDLGDRTPIDLARVLDFEYSTMSSGRTLWILGRGHGALTKSGERAKRVMRWKRLEIGLSHEPGDTRHGRKMKAGYGHIRGSYGAAEDGMAIDVYVGPDLGSDRVFKVKQVVPDTGELDEYKYLIGCWDKDEAQQLYLAHMPKRFLGGVEAADFETELGQFQQPERSRLAKFLVSRHPYFALSGPDSP